MAHNGFFLKKGKNQHFFVLSLVIITIAKKDKMTFLSFEIQISVNFLNFWCFMRTLQYHDNVKKLCISNYDGSGVEFLTLVLSTYSLLFTQINKWNILEASLKLAPFFASRIFFYLFG